MRSSTRFLMAVPGLSGRGPYQGPDQDGRVELAVIDDGVGVPRTPDLEGASPSVSKSWESWPASFAERGS